MSNQPSSHLVAISHDPLEEGMTAGLDQTDFGRGARRGFSGRPARMGHRSAGGLMRGLGGGRRGAMAPEAWRPVLLAGAIGLFAAWVVSGMGERQSKMRQPRQNRRGGSGDEGSAAGRWSRQSGAPGYDAAGPEGYSSPHEFELDAMNP